MKNECRLVIAITLILLSIQFAVAAENEYGEVKAWCNGERATVNELSVKVGEPINITVRVTSRIDGYVDIQLKEPWTTHSYDVISGPSELDEWITEQYVEPGWTQEYTWILAANGEWTDGRSPIMVDVSFHKDPGDKRDAGMTIASPIILDKQYSALDKPGVEDDVKGTDDMPASVPDETPGFGIIAGLAGFMMLFAILKKE
ncbi:MAG: sarcinarray family MAST domain-containing protein [ANME-2 cluster archaeon]|nr:sarcinarray family MAST domain-containing protein [ANME-2 cluster archaeon]